MQSILLEVAKLTSLLTIDKEVRESGRRKQGSPNESDDTCKYTGVSNGWDFLDGHVCRFMYPAFYVWFSIYVGIRYKPTKYTFRKLIF